MMMEETRLGIPALFHEECLVGCCVKTPPLFPSSLNYGSSWDPALVSVPQSRLVKRPARWAVSRGWHRLDVSRDVRWGRTEETFGEDPWLVGVMASAYVRDYRAKNATCWRP
jgi:beta-glucosidase